jgi:hypothetical protein
MSLVHTKRGEVRRSRSSGFAALSYDFDVLRPGDELPPENIRACRMAVRCAADRRTRRSAAKDARSPAEPHFSSANAPQRAGASRWKLANEHARCEASAIRSGSSLANRIERREP